MERAVLAKKHSVPRPAVRQPANSAPQMGGGASTGLADVRVFAAGDACIRSVGNEEGIERCGVKHGDVGGPWVTVKTLGVSGFLLPTFLCRGKEK